MTALAEPNHKTRSIDLLLRRMIELRGSDLHLVVGIPPRVNIDGDKVDIGTITGALDDGFVESVIFDQILADRPKLAERLREEWDLDTSYAIENVGRFRVNVMRERSHYSLVIRVIPSEIPRFETLGLPDVVQTFANIKNGLVLFAGETGSGKSTALAALLDIVNRTKAKNIITIEDPLEFEHTSKKGTIRHREVGTTVKSFDEALRRALRQAPDVILVGEIRDPETIRLAVRAAEVGCLVFSTIHARSAADTITRIVDSFPDTVRDAVRVQLASSLSAVVCQQLVKKKGVPGRVAATEVMVVDNPTRAAIHAGNLDQVNISITTGRDRGCHLMDFSLSELVRSNEISEETAIDACNDVKMLSTYLNRPQTSAYVPGAGAAAIYG